MARPLGGGGRKPLHSDGDGVMFSRGRWDMEGAGLGMLGKVPRDRIELSTPAFSVPCSTN